MVPIPLKSGNACLKLSCPHGTVCKEHMGSAAYCYRVLEKGERCHRWDELTVCGKMLNCKHTGLFNKVFGDPQCL